jgi:hypothetical protein
VTRVRNVNQAHLLRALLILNLAEPFILTDSDVSGKAAAGGQGVGVVAATASTEQPTVSEMDSASQKTVHCPKLGEADPGGLGACPQKISRISGFLLFQKRSKSVSSASQKTVQCPKLGEADPGGLGACPQQNSRLWGKGSGGCVCQDLADGRRGGGRWGWGRAGVRRRI